MLRIPARIHAEMLAHAIAGLPNEACGLLAGPAESDDIGGTGDTAGDPADGEVTSFVPLANAAESADIYQLDPHEMMAAERSVEQAGQALIGVMHSHTRTTAYPSPTDVDDASRFDPFGSWRFVIVSLKHPEPALRCYRILGAEITEETVTVVAG